MGLWGTLARPHPFIVPISLILELMPREQNGLSDL